MAQAKKSKPAVNYREASVKGKNCGTCVSMMSDGRCRKVAGPVDRRHVCDLYQKG